MSSCATRSANSLLSVASTALAKGSCSAWDSKSAAKCAGLDFSSATIMISLGPATMSMPTSPNTWRLASVTYALPGPVILSTRRMLSVPYASAATAWAPPAFSTRCTPAILAANSTAWLTLPPMPGGVVMHTSGQPAITAGMAFISTVEG